jgi:peptidoglycan/xylan/chitin deacetylase (PgdA/CDA1 family)
MRCRLLLSLAACVLLAACGGDTKHPKTATTPAAAPATAPPAHAPRDTTAAVRRLARYGRPVFCGAQHGDMVALTFDDGPGAYTHFVLKRLRRNRMRATFFLNTKNFDRFAQWIPREMPYGTVGDHTATHAFLPGLPPAGWQREIDSAQEAIGRKAGIPITLFRPPYGAHTPAIDAHVRARGMLQIIWNVDSGDSRGANYAQIRREVIRRLHPGAIVLMHDNRGQTVRALPDILHAVRRKHLRAVTVSEMMAKYPPSSAQLRAGPKGCPGTR